MVWFSFIKYDSYMKMCTKSEMQKKIYRVTCIYIYWLRKSEFNLLSKNMFCISTVFHFFSDHWERSKTLSICKNIECQCLFLPQIAEYYLLCPWACRGNILVSNHFSFSQCIPFSQFSLSTFMIEISRFSWR